MEINPQPVYEADQVVTYLELKMMIRGCAVLYEQTRWWNWIERLKIRATVGCLQAMMIWMTHGKPSVQI